MFGRIESERRNAEGKTEIWLHYAAVSKRFTPRKLMAILREHWASKTTSIGRSTWSSTRTTPERARTTRRKISPLSGGWRSTS
jgi:hypothetical protein